METLGSVCRAFMNRNLYQAFLGQKFRMGRAFVIRKALGGVDGAMKSGVL